MVRGVEWIRASRVGWGETEYDDEGEQAPLRWTCERCGCIIMVERLNCREDIYEMISEEQKQSFIDEHKDCVPVRRDEAASVESSADNGSDFIEF